MKPKFLLFAALALAAVATHAREEKQPASTPAARSIVILYENDVHCAVDGYAKVAGFRDAIADTADVMLVSNGDFVQGMTVGAISKGQYVIDIMRAMNYDAITLGNHEYDYGMERLFQLLRQVPTPIVCANLYDYGLQRLVYAPYVLRRVGGKQIAFVGVSTPTSVDTEAYAFRDDKGTLIYDLQHEDLAGLVQRAVDEARRAGADYVVLDSHLGEEETDRNSDSHTIVSKTRGIDIVLDGHSHSVIKADIVNNIDGKPVVVSQTGTKFANVGKLVIAPDGKMTTELIPLDQLTAKNAYVAAITDSIHALLEAETSRVICRTEVPLRILDDEGNEIARLGEVNAGDIVTDAFRFYTGSDIGILNSGGIRNEINKTGEVTYGDLLSLLPYDNNIVVAEAKGSTIQKMLEKLVSFLPKTDGQFPQVSGLKFTTRVADHSVSDVQVLNSATQHYEPLNPDRTYTIATTKYCVNDGGLYDTLKNCPIILETQTSYNEAFIEYVTKNLGGHIGKEYAEPQGRITVIK